MTPASKRERARDLRDAAAKKTGLMAGTLRDIAQQLEVQADAQERAGGLEGPSAAERAGCAVSKSAQRGS
jgi:hypothetical protein